MARRLPVKKKTPAKKAPAKKKAAVFYKVAVKKKPTTLSAKEIKPVIIGLMLTRIPEIGKQWLAANQKNINAYHAILAKIKADKEAAQAEIGKSLQRRQAIAAIRRGDFGCRTDGVIGVVNAMTGFKITRAEVNNSSVRAPSTVHKSFQLRNGLVIKMRPAANNRQKIVVAVKREYHETRYNLYSGGDCIEIRPSQQQLDIDSIITDPEELRTVLMKFPLTTLKYILNSISSNSGL